MNYIYYVLTVCLLMNQVELYSANLGSWASRTGLRGMRFAPGKPQPTVMSRTITGGPRPPMVQRSFLPSRSLVQHPAAPSIGLAATGLAAKAAYDYYKGNPHLLRLPEIEAYADEDISFAPPTPKSGFAPEDVFSDGSKISDTFKRVGGQKYRPTPTQPGDTPFHIAVKEGNINKVIDHSNDEFEENENHQMVIYGYPKTQERYSSNSNGNLGVTEALLAGHLDIVGYLLQDSLLDGFFLRHRNNDGLTGRQIAEELYGTSNADILRSPYWRPFLKLYRLATGR